MAQPPITYFEILANDFQMHELDFYERHPDRLARWCACCEDENVSIATIQKHVPVDNPYIRQETRKDYTPFVVITKQKHFPTTNPLAPSRTYSDVLYKEAVHDLHKRKGMFPRSYLLELEEKDFCDAIYTDIILYRSITSAKCAAFLIAEALQKRIVAPHINTLTNLKEALPILEKLDIFIRDKILDGHQQIKGSDPEKFLTALNTRIDEFIDEVIKQKPTNEMLAYEREPMIREMQFVVEQAIANKISPKEQAMRRLDFFRKKFNSNNLHILGVTTTDLQTAFIDAVGMLICKDGRWDKEKEIATITISGNDFLRKFDIPATDINRDAVYAYLRNEISPIRLLTQRDGMVIDAQCFTINREISAGEPARGGSKADTWKIIAYPDVYMLYFLEQAQNPENKIQRNKDCFKFYSNILQRAFLGLPIKKIEYAKAEAERIKANDQGTDEKKPRWLLDPDYDGLFNILHRLQVDLAKTGHIDEPLSRYGYNEAEDTNAARQHPKLKRLQAALDTITNNLELYRKPKSENPERPLYIRGGFGPVQQELHKKSLQSHTAKATKKEAKATSKKTKKQ